MKKFKILSPLVFISGLIIYIIFIQKITVIVCQNEGKACDQEYINNFDYLAGKSHFTARRNIKQLLDNDPKISKYQIRYQLPSKFVVNIVEYKPAYAISSTKDEWVALITKDGYVVSIEEKTDLLKISKDTIPNEGDKVDNGILFSFRMFKKLINYYDIQKAELKEDGFFIETEEGMQAIFPTQGDEEVLLGAFLIVFNRLNSSDEISIIDNRDSGDTNVFCENGCLVDFRFKNPIIKNTI